MVRRLFPRAPHLGVEVHAARHDHERLGGKQRRERGALESLLGFRVAAHVHGEDERDFRRFRCALRHEVEVAQLDDFVAPEFEAHGLGHPESVHVDDAAAHRELRDVLDHLHALEADRFEMCRQRVEPPDVAAPELETGRREGLGQPRALQHGARGREQDADLAARHALEGLDALARDLGVRLHFAESFARRIERDELLAEHRLQVGQPAFGFRQLIGDDGQHPVRRMFGERSHEHGVAGAREPRDALRSTPGGERAEQPLERRKFREPFDQRRKRHDQPTISRPSVRSRASRRLPRRAAARRAR